jgi:hypothetical protein
LAAVVLLVCTSMSFGQVSYQRVALRGDAAPGAVGVNPTIHSVDQPVINDAGQVAFGASLNIDNAVGGTSGMFLWAPGELRIVAQNETAAPGTGGATFDFLSGLTLGDSGVVGFNSTLQGAGVTPANREGMFSGNGLGVALVARSGVSAPGWPGGTLEGMGGLRITNDGRIFFAGAVADPASPTGHGGGLWYGTSANPQLVIRTQGQAPGAPIGSVVNDFFNVRTSDNGNIALGASISGPGPVQNRHVVYSGTSGNLQMVASGAAPGTSAEFSFFTGVAINDAGVIALNAHLSGVDVDDANNEGIWVGSAGGLELVARVGDQAPGTAAGTKYSANDGQREDQWDSLTEPLINSSGEIAFRARFDGAADATNNWGIYAGAGGDLTLIARSGEIAPGAGPGVVFKGSIDGAEWIAPFGSPAINDAGQVAFLASLSGPGIGEEYNPSLFASAADGTLHLIAMPGQMFDVGGGDLREISGVGFTSYDDSVNGSTTINSAGQIVFALSFMDGSNGVFIATVPEPGAGLLLVIAAALGLGRRRWIN